MWDCNIIDLDEAIERVMGNKEMYKRWLDNFFVPDTMSLVENAFMTGNHDDAHRAVHKLKGTAGNLAILKLFEQARNLDEKIKLKEDFESLQPEFQKLMDFYSEAESMYKESSGEIEEYDYEE